LHFDLAFTNNYPVNTDSIHAKLVAQSPRFQHRNNKRRLTYNLKVNHWWMCLPNLTCLPASNRDL